MFLILKEGYTTPEWIAQMETFSMATPFQIDLEPLKSETLYMELFVKDYGGNEDFVHNYYTLNE
jgi:hypothetical protein